LSHAVPLLSFECNLPEFAGESIECLALLLRHCPTAEFNYCVEEPPVRLASKRWLGAGEMASIVKSARHAYMEIYCKSVRNPARAQNGKVGEHRV
jgi:hypothetical protein